jgi:hypothetical protein
MKIVLVELQSLLTEKETHLCGMEGGLLSVENVICFYVEHVADISEVQPTYAENALEVMTSY